MSYAPQPGTTAAPIAGSSEFDEGLALFVTFAILVLLSTWDVTAKFALWVGIALLALVWNSAIQSGEAKTFWNALAQ